ncbi:MAG: MMPL family transporter, partial [Maioricimonas sp. JB045]
QRLSRVHDAIRDALPAIASSLGESLPDDFAESAEIFMLGPTASVRDIKAVTDHDRMVIDILVVVAVYLVLVALLGRPAIGAYLIVTVVFSFLVAMGATYMVFQAIDGETFAGLDWKIPIFLFTLLIAMGEDYNILLMARVQEEQQTHGPVKGVLVALSRTGSIISSCGIIMAGTFSSLMTGTLRGMVQMGFALTFGVLLDTFVIRPILVPAYLVLLHRGRFGILGRWLGARPEEIEPQMPGELTEREPSAAVGGVPGFEGADD